MTTSRPKLYLTEDKPETGNYPIITLAGNLDIYTAQELRKVFEKHLGNTELRFIVIDVEKLEYMDSSGIGILFSTAIRLKKREGGVYLVRPQEAVLMALQITKALAQVTVCDSLEEVAAKISE